MELAELYENNAHVVAGPIRLLRRNDYERASKRIVTDHRVTIVTPEN